MGVYFIQGIGRGEPCYVKSLFFFLFIYQLIFELVQNEPYYPFDLLKASRVNHGHIIAQIGNEPRDPPVTKGR